MTPEQMKEIKIASKAVKICLSDVNKIDNKISYIRQETKFETEFMIFWGDLWSCLFKGGTKTRRIEREETKKRNRIREAWLQSMESICAVAYKQSGVRRCLLTLVNLGIFYDNLSHAKSSLDKAEDARLCLVDNVGNQVDSWNANFSPTNGIKRQLGNASKAVAQTFGAINKDIEKLSSWSYFSYDHHWDDVKKLCLLMSAIHKEGVRHATDCLMDGGDRKKEEPFSIISFSVPYSTALEHGRCLVLSLKSETQNHMISTVEQLLRYIRSDFFEGERDSIKKKSVSSFLDALGKLDKSYCARSVIGAQSTDRLTAALAPDDTDKLLDLLEPFLPEKRIHDKEYSKVCTT